MDTPDKDLQELLQRLDPETRLFALEFNIGKDAEEFLNSSLGKTLVGMAQQDYVDALLQLERVPWWRRRKIMELQNRATMARTFCDWLRELIIKGKQAERILSEQEPTNG